MTIATPIAIAPQFVVPDVVAAAEHYRDILGFTIHGYFGQPPVFAMVRRGGAEIHFGKSENAPPHPNRTVRALGLDAYIWVDDVKALHEELVGRRATILEGPVRRIYGSLELLVQDCFGFTLAFGE